MGIWPSSLHYNGKIKNTAMTHREVFTLNENIHIEKVLAKEAYIG
jgi:hypothetical protein